MFSCIHSSICKIVTRKIYFTKLPRNNSKYWKPFCQFLHYRPRCSQAYVPSGNSGSMRWNTPEFYSIFTPELKKLHSMFDRHGYELRIVGGAVRDILIGIKPYDLDLATTANPDEMKNMFEAENVRMLNNRGEKHGTITARIDDRANFEITSLRTDLYCDGRHAKVLFITDWKKDAARRDLTINSMYLGLDGTLYDYFGGYDDLKSKKVIFVGDAEKRIEEDYLRILRYFRFFGRIVDNPNSHDKHTLQAIQRKAHGLTGISGERIWAELSRILKGNYKKEIMLKMLDLELGQFMGLGDSDKLDKQLFAITCDLEQKYTLKPVTYIAALLTRQEQVFEFHSRVKLSSFDRDLALFLVYHKLDDDCISLQDKLKSLQYLLACTSIPKEQMRQYIVELLKFKDNDELLIKFESWELPHFPVDRSAIKEIVKIKASKQLKIIEHKLVETWILSDFKLTADELLREIPAILSEIDVKQHSNF